jgi:ribonuclease Y
MVDGLGFGGWFLLAFVAVLLVLLVVAVVVVLRRSRTSVASPSIVQLELEEARREATEVRQRAEHEGVEIRRQAETAAQHALQARDDRADPAGAARA